MKKINLKIEEWLPIFIGGIWVIYILVKYITIFGGDPEIHIIFAKNLLKFNILEFNPGYKTGGETSPLYMTIVAGLILILGESVQYGMKVIGFISLYVICNTLYNANNKAINSRKALLVVMVITMPFFIFQASLGMENMLFSAIGILIISHWYKSKNPSLIITIPIITLTFLLRPEALLLGFWIFVYSFLTKNKKGVFLSFISMIVMISMYKFINLYTGVDTQSAGFIRAFLSKSESYRVILLGLNIYINKKVFIGCIYLMPIITVIGINYKKLNNLDLSIILTMFIVPLVFHTLNIFPNVHFSRYFLFEYCVIFFVFSFRFLNSIKYKYLLSIYFFILFISFAEYNSRNIPKYEVKDSIISLSKDEITKYSNYLVETLHPDKLPIVIGLQEVQIRGKLDDRFIIWSLDGITDNQLKNYLTEESIDHFQYIKSRNIEYIFGLPNYNINKEALSLDIFSKTMENKFLCVDNISLQKTPITDLYKVVRCK